MIFLKKRREIRSRRLVSFYDKFIQDGDKVLDIGCGDGALAYQIKQLLKKNFKLVGVDVVPNNPPYEFRLIKGSKLPFDDNKFEIAMLNDVLHHIEYERQLDVVREASRVAKKVLICEVPNTQFSRFADKINNLGKTMEIPFCMRSKNDWQNLFNQFNVDSHVVKAEILHPIKNNLFCIKNDK